MTVPAAHGEVEGLTKPFLMRMCVSSSCAWRSAGERRRRRPLCGRTTFEGSKGIVCSTPLISDGALGSREMTARNANSTIAISVR